MKNTNHLSRRDFLGTAAAGAASLTILPHLSYGSSGGGGSDRPNILHIITDQQ